MVNYRLDSQQVTESILTSRIREASQYVKVAVGIHAGGDPQLKSLSEIDQQINAVKQFDYGYLIFCWEYTSNFLRKAIYLFRKLH